MITSVCCMTINHVNLSAINRLQWTSGFGEQCYCTSSSSSVSLSS
jgi:hypothetical protein